MACLNNCVKENIGLQQTAWEHECHLGEFTTCENGTKVIKKIKGTFVQDYQFYEYPWENCKLTSSQTITRNSLN